MLKSNDFMTQRNKRQRNLYNLVEYYNGRKLQEKIFFFFLLFRKEIKQKGVNFAICYDKPFLFAFSFIIINVCWTVDDGWNFYERFGLKINWNTMQWSWPFFSHLIHKVYKTCIPTYVYAANRIFFLGGNR